MHTVFALLCFVVVIHWLIFTYPSGLLHWHCGNLTIAPVSAKQPWWIWINTSCEFIMNDCITTTKQSTTKPCAYCLGYTVCKQRPHTDEHYYALFPWEITAYKIIHAKQVNIMHCNSNELLFWIACVRKYWFFCIRENHHAPVVWNLYHWVAIEYLYQPCP